MSTKAKAYSYIRFSSAEQLKGDSHRRQLDDSRSYATANGLTLDETLTFRDLGVSGFRGRNVREGALGAFIRAVQEGKVAKGSYLLVESLDRISRDNILNAIGVFTDLLQLGITIVTFSDNMTYTEDSVKDNPMELMASLLIFSRANEESLTKSKRISAAWATKRKATANGHKMTSRCPAWLKLNDTKDAYAIVPDKADVVRRIYQLALDGVGQSSIERLLNREGVPSIGKATAWHSSYIFKILNSRAVIGEYQPQTSKVDEDTHVRHRIPDGPVIEGYFPIVVEPDVFYRVQQARKSRSVNKGRKGKAFSNIFNGIGRCMYCNSTLHHVNKGRGPRGGQYLVCSDARRGLDCHYAAIRYSTIETLVLGTLNELDFSKLLPEQIDRSKGDIRVINESLLSNSAEVSDLQQSVERLLDIASHSTEPSASIATRIGKSEARISELERQRGQLEDSLDALTREATAAQQTASDFKESYQLLRETMAVTEGNQDEVFTQRVRLNSQLKDIVRELLVQEWPDIDLATKVVGPNLHSQGKLSDSELEKFTSFFTQSKGRIFCIILKLKAEGHHKGRALLVNKALDVIVLNEVVDTEEEVHPTGDQNEHSIEELEARLAEHIAEGRGLSFFDSLEDTSFVTDVTFTNVAILA